MAFMDKRLPLRIHPGTSGSLRLASEQVNLRSGYEHVNNYWSEGLRTYDLRRLIKTEHEYQEIYAFFLSVAEGRLNGFRFTDLSDYKVPDLQNLSRPFCQTVGGSTTQFQLVKVYSSFGQYHTRVIKKPIEGTVRIYINDVYQTADYEVNYSTGIITFDSAPAATPQVEFEFDTPVKFGEDSLPHSWEGPYIFNSPITLREIRL